MINVQSDVEGEVPKEGSWSEGSMGRHVGLAAVRFFNGQMVNLEDIKRKEWKGNEVMTSLGVP